MDSWEKINAAIGLTKKQHLIAKAIPLLIPNDALFIKTNMTKEFNN